MTKHVVLFLVWSTTLSCKEPGSVPDNPCYKCQIAETYLGMTSNSYWERCGATNVATFVQANTYSRFITQGRNTYVLSRVATCLAK